MRGAGREKHRKGGAGSLATVPAEPRVAITTTLGLHECEKPFLPRYLFSLSQLSEDWKNPYNHSTELQVSEKLTKDRDGQKAMTECPV